MLATRLDSRQPLPSRSLQSNDYSKNLDFYPNLIRMGSETQGTWSHMRPGSKNNSNHCHLAYADYTSAVS